MLLMTPEGKKVVVDTGTDECLYEAPRNPPNTGTAYTSGTDYYAHRARSGKYYFYSYHWSMWQGEQSHYELLTEEEMKEKILELAGFTYPAEMGGYEKKLAEKHFPGIFEEDA
jgi:hypothetical protein